MLFETIASLKVFKQTSRAGKNPFKRLSDSKVNVKLPAVIERVHLLPVWDISAAKAGSVNKVCSRYA